VPRAVIWPPGEAITLLLPNNSCYLYGNYSTDDVGIIRYEWKKFTSTDLSADMQVFFANSRILILVDFMYYGFLFDLI
jgi:hypothetical protein